MCIFESAEDAMFRGVLRPKPTPPRVPGLAAQRRLPVGIEYDSSTHPRPALLVGGLLRSSRCWAHTPGCLPACLRTVLARSFSPPRLHHLRRPPSQKSVTCWHGSRCAPLNYAEAKVSQSLPLPFIFVSPPITLRLSTPHPHPYPAFAANQFSHAAAVPRPMLSPCPVRFLSPKMPHPLHC